MPKKHINSNSLLPSLEHSFSLIVAAVVERRSIFQAKQLGIAINRSLYLVFAIAIPNLCYAEVTKLSAEDREILQDSSRFHEVHSTKDLPPAIVALCVDDKGKLADPGQNWNATDAIADRTLPWKRLIWAAVGSDYYVVHYERGGIDQLVSRFGCETHKE